MTKEEKKKHCAGCRDNFYNYDGNSTTGCCWALPSMKLILRKRVPIDQRPPWDQDPEKLPSCYRQKGYVFVGKNQTF